MSANKINSQDIDWTGSTGYASGAYLGYGGTFQVPTGAIPAISNIIWVSKNGNDTTALSAFTAAGNKQVFAYPFLTLAAARSAAISLTPSATNRILIKVFSGYYTEQLVLANYVDWDLSNSTIEWNGTGGTITDNGSAYNSIIYGNSTISHTTTSNYTSDACIQLAFGGTNLIIYASTIKASNGHLIINYSSTVNVFCSNNIITSDADAIYNPGGNTTINGNITMTGNGIFGGNAGSGTVTLNGNLTITGTGTVIGGSSSNPAINYTINGNILATNLTNIIYITLFFGGGFIVINGNIVGTGITSNGILNNSTTTPITINGNISIGGSANSAISSTQNGTIRLNNSRILTTTNNADCISQTTGNIILNNCTLIPNGTGKSISNSSTVYVYGHCQTSAAIGTGVTQKVGTLTVDSSVI